MPFLQDVAVFIGRQSSICAVTIFISIAPGAQAQIRTAEPDINAATQHLTGAPGSSLQKPTFELTPERKATHFYKGLRERGTSLGYAFETADRRPDSRFYSGAFTWGKFVKPSLQLTLETPVSYFNKPKGDASLAAIAGVRYFFRRRRNLAPFIEAGSGPTLINESNENLSGALQFSSYAGVGVRISRGRSAIHAVLRFHHVSNGELSEPNDGINAGQFVLGFTRYQ